MTTDDNKITKKKTNKHLQGKYFRWVVPQLGQFSDENQKKIYKNTILTTLLESKTAKKGIKDYMIALETHADGNMHLDVLLVFTKKVRMSPTELDVLCQKHGNLTRYRTLNRAILAYSFKEDMPLTNASDTAEVLLRAMVTQNPVEYFIKKLKENIFTFDIVEYAVQHNLMPYLKNWSQIKSKVKETQEVLANTHLAEKKGIKLITNQLIKQTLTSSEYLTYLSWPGYTEIVEFINEIHQYGYQRPFKSKNLLLVGPPNTGKTSLNRELTKYISTYEIGVNKWWPKYKDFTYKFMSWNEFSLGVMPYTHLLKLLEGTMVNLEQKGGHTVRRNNQLIIMNSNITYRDHIRIKFHSWTKVNMQTEALKNFPARVTQIIIPEGYTLFLLLKLIQPLED